VNAEIVSTGTELLLGKNCNEDARILCEVLAKCGIDVYRYTTVGDNVERVAKAYSEALNRADIVISTGGLGGTDDDVSKQAASLALNVPLEKNETIERFLMERNVSSQRIVTSFSEIPKGAILFKNTVGVAPGIVIQTGKKYLILLPGPPAELKSILKNGLEDFLKKLGKACILNEAVKIYGMMESEVEEIIHDLTLSKNPTVATFLKKGWIEISITSKAKDEIEARKMIDKMKEEILKRFPQERIGKKEETLEEEFYALFSKKGLTISTAESITAGMLASKIVNVSGVSSVFMGGVVVYSNEAKEKILGISHEILETYGAVSKECVQEMAKNVKDIFNTSVGAAITGIAGPTGGTKEKPVGTVWFAVSYKNEVKSWKRVYAGNRNEIREMATNDILEFIVRNF
jgi:nicotinamide-nucleotide amidase